MTRRITLSGTRRVLDRSTYSAERGRSGQIVTALDALGAALVGQLSAVGWRSRRLDEHALLTLTGPVSNGVMAVAELQRRGFRWPDDWPVELVLTIGVGYEPALDLRPVLTLHPCPIEVRAGERTFGLARDHPRDIDELAVRMSSYLTGQPLLATFPDGAAVYQRVEADAAAHAERDDPAPENTADGDDQIAENALGDDDPAAGDHVTADRTDDDERRRIVADGDTAHLFVLLAALGRLDEARATLDGFPTAADEFGTGHRRFARQAHRWLAAGGPVPPPVETTLARLPADRRSSPRTWASIKAEATAKKEAYAATRARARGRTRTELAELLTREYEQRGLFEPPSTIAYQADHLHTEQQPFGRLSLHLKGLSMLASAGFSTMRAFRSFGQADPDFLLPPDRAAFRVRAARGQVVPVTIDSGTDALLDRAEQEAPLRSPSRTQFDVWLSTEGYSGPVKVHLGDQQVGKIHGEDAVVFSETFAAAALFDEDPLVTAQLSRPPGHGRVLEVGRPDPAAWRRSGGGASQ